jgi:hypothetical protein
MQEGRRSDGVRAVLLRYCLEMAESLSDAGFRRPAARPITTEWHSLKHLACGRLLVVPSASSKGARALCSCSAPCPCGPWDKWSC